MVNTPSSFTGWNTSSSEISSATTIFTSFKSKDIVTSTSTPTVESLKSHIESSTKPSTIFIAKSSAIRTTSVSQGSSTTDSTTDGDTSSTLPNSANIPTSTGSGDDETSTYQRSSLTIKSSITISTVSIVTSSSSKTTTLNTVDIGNIGCSSKTTLIVHFFVIIIAIF